MQWNFKHYLTQACTHQNNVLPYQKIQLQNNHSPFCGIYALLAIYAAYNGRSLPIFRGNLWVLSSKVKHSSGQEVQDCLTLEDGPIGCPKISVVTHYTLGFVKSLKRADLISHRDGSLQSRGSVMNTLHHQQTNKYGAWRGGYMSNDKVPNRIWNYVSGSNFNKFFPKKKNIETNLTKSQFKIYSNTPSNWVVYNNLTK